MNQKGFLSALLGYCLWGLFPIYWKQLGHVSSIETLAHRMVWSFIFLLCVLIVIRKWKWLKPTLKSPKLLLRFTCAAALLSINWGLFLWAITSGYIVESSLGYFINPLLNVALGMIVFREKLRPLQWFSLFLAVAGVVYLTVGYGRPPYIALILAFSFGLYGLFKKTAPLDAIEGLSLETGLMFVPALCYLLWLRSNGNMAMGSDVLTSSLLIGGGVVTAVPLLLFAYGAQRIQFSTLGLLQYIAPTGQFLIGVLLYDEAFTRVQAVGYSMIWVALIIYSAESLTRHRQKPLMQEV